MSKIRNVSLAALLLAGACAPLSLNYREGVTVARMEQDQTACDLSALKQVPRDIRQRYIPPLRQPYTHCNAHRKCHTYYRILSPGRWESYDASKDLRHKVAAQCMSLKGYSRVSIPACDAPTIEATALRATRVLPPLTEKSCAIRLKSGRYQIVTPDAE